MSLVFQKTPQTHPYHGSDESAHKAFKIMIELVEDPHADIVSQDEVHFMRGTFVSIKTRYEK